MANVSASKAGALLSNNESTLIKRAINISWLDIVEAGTYSDNDTVTFTIPVKAGEAITHVGVKLLTAFTDSGSGDELDVTVGDGSDPDGFITAADLHDSQTEISYVANTGAYIDTEVYKLYTSDDTVDILLTPNISTGTDYALSELTAGEIKVTVYALDLN